MTDDNAGGDEMPKRTCGVEEAGRVLGIGRSLSYELAKAGRFPVRVLRLGRLYRVPVAELNRLLGEDGREE